MYASTDLQICVHECRVTAEDDTYVATLAPNKDLKLLDLTPVLEEPESTEFESLDLTIHMLFLAGEHSYEICRSIALAASEAGYNGLVYPSYFSLIYSGHIPFETTYGISHRRIPQFAPREESKIAQNLGAFRPSSRTANCPHRVHQSTDIEKGPLRLSFRPGRIVTLAQATLTAAVGGVRPALSKKTSPIPSFRCAAFSLRNLHSQFNAQVRQDERPVNEPLENRHHGIQLTRFRRPTPVSGGAASLHQNFKDRLFLTRDAIVLL